MRNIAIPFSLFVLLFYGCTQKPNKTFNTSLNQYCSGLETEFDSISDERKELLAIIGDYLNSRIVADGSVDVIFICQHNSRKSHFSQQWLQTAMYYYQYDKINVYSGGTEPSKPFPEMIAALTRAGHEITRFDKDTANPRYLVKRGQGFPEQFLSSKLYNSEENPREGYCAIMACLNPEECCPVVYGPDRQFTIPYGALEEYDNTPLQQAKYDEKCKEVARDMFFLVNYLKQLST